MKTWLHAMAMCQSMFCAIPCPWNIWDEDAKDRMLLFLPMVGLEIGLIWALLAWAIQLLTLPGWINGVVLCAYPFLVTGYMHLDGFMDVTDAVKSWRDLVRRREILKDSHVGSFASSAACCFCWRSSPASPRRIIRCRGSWCWCLWSAAAAPPLPSVR